MPVSCIKVTLKGRTFGGGDQWQTGFHTPPLVAPSQVDLEDYALTAVTLFASSFWNDATINDYFPNTNTLTGASAALLDASGHVILTGESSLASPIQGGASTNVLPAEVATVVTLLTPTAGARGRGRMYLPSMAGAVTDGSGQLLTTVQQDVVNGMKDFFDTWNSDPITLPVGVASQVGGFVTTVNRIRVGNVFDAQRRRRNAVGEVYIQEDLA